MTTQAKAQVSARGSRGGRQDRPPLKWVPPCEIVGVSVGKGEAGLHNSLYQSLQETGIRSCVCREKLEGKNIQRGENHEERAVTLVRGLHGQGPELGPGPPASTPWVTGHIRGPLSEVGSRKSHCLQPPKISCGRKIPKN